VPCDSCVSHEPKRPRHTRLMSHVLGTFTSGSSSSRVLSRRFPRAGVPVSGTSAMAISGDATPQTRCLGDGFRQTTRERARRNGTASRALAGTVAILSTFEPISFLSRRAVSALHDRRASGGQCRRISACSDPWPKGSNEAFQPGDAPPASQGARNSRRGALALLRDLGEWATIGRSEPPRRPERQAGF
jgi:hypothetical protein